jgi:hypothetical protein
MGYVCCFTAQYQLRLMSMFFPQTSHAQVNYRTARVAGQNRKQILYAHRPSAQTRSGQQSCQQPPADFTLCATHGV